MSNKVQWSSYQLDVCLKDGNWRKVGGIYILAGLTPRGWVAYYIGKTVDFSARPASHEMWAEAVRLGATHVHAMEVGQESQRVAIEKELIGIYKPPLNSHHVW